jgi:hypothetical protein
MCGIGREGAGIRRRAADDDPIGGGGGGGAGGQRMRGGDDPKNNPPPPPPHIRRRDLKSEPVSMRVGLRWGTLPSRFFRFFICVYSRV